ncbi:MAG: hypothetical protein KF873_22520 [Gemmataceae bacterium]|nr:hypothetical protein [Gemmataceae bacterium]
MSERCAFLLSPYRPPTSYPVTLNANECAAWINGYVALWHPAVLARLVGPPLPASVYDHDQPGEGCVFVVPEGPTVYQADDWLDRVKAANAIAFASSESRSRTYENLKDALVGVEGWREIDDELVRLFAGLGFGYLVVDTLFEAMNHEKLLDAVGFWKSVSEAATRVDEPAECRRLLKDAAEKLRTAREGAHSGSIFLLEWILPDPANLGAPWPACIAAKSPATVIVDAATLRRLNDEQPDRFAELKAGLPTDLPAAFEICVSAEREREDALLPIESQLWNLRAGRAAARKLLGIEPSVFARRTSVFQPQLPSWLSLAGYRHGIATSLDGATVPTRYSAVVGWPGPDGKSIDVFTRDPLPAHDPQTFFNLAYHLHQAITHDSTPTLTLLHKREPGEGYSDLLALSELASVIGEPATMSRYFSETHAGDYTGVASADEFFADYLDDRVTNRHRPDAVGGFAKHARLRRRVDAALTLAALHRSLNPVTPGELDRLVQLQELEREIETRGPDPGTEGLPDQASEKLVALEAAIAQPLAERLQVRAVENRPGHMVLNSCGFTRRVLVELPNQPGPIPVEGPVKSCEYADGTLRAVVEVPGLGFAWLPRGSASTPLFKTKIKTAELTTVRNEFFEAELDPATGGLRAFRDMKTRINRLGQYLVYNPGSKVVATSVQVTNAGPALGEVTAIGRIENEHGETLAEFRQRIRAWIGRPALELSIEITPKHQPAGYPWHAYFAGRFGWRDDRAATFRGVNGSNSQSTHARPVSPDYLEFRLGKERTFLFTGGLPFVQRHGQRMMDVVLIPEGETTTRFDLLLAFDRENPMQTATGWTLPPTIVETTKGPPHIGATGWLGNIDLPSLLLTSLRPVGDTKSIEARFIETAGFAGSAELRLARDPASAKLVDLMGEPLQDLTLLEGAIPLEFSAGELLAVRAEFE